MATEPKAATEEPKIDLFEDDDEFEEFEINESLHLIPIEFWFDSLCALELDLARFVAKWEDMEEGKEIMQQWEDDWDDDDVNDDFSLQLRRELESNTEKKN
ncbi:hypothetical protein C3L33_14342, partial [Rhododendron williamsianum]